MNPFLKTCITLVAGGALVGLDAAIAQIVPTGGFAQTLQSYPSLAVAFAGGLSLAHNAISRWEAQLGIPQQPAAPAAPQK